MSSFVDYSTAFIYSNKESRIHKLDPRTKLIITITFIFYCYLRPISNIIGLFIDLIVATIIILVIINLAKVGNEVKKVLKTYLVFFLITIPMLIIIYNFFPPYTTDPFLSSLIENKIFILPANPILLFDFSITYYSIIFPMLTVYRLVLLLLVGQIFLLTTDLDNIELLMLNLRIPYWFVLTVSFTFRFIPTLIIEANRILEAQLLRGLNAEEGNFLVRWYRKTIPLLIPLIVNSLRRSIRFAEALETRAFLSSKKTTKLYSIKMKKSDYIVAILFLILLMYHILNVYLSQGVLFFPDHQMISNR
ncbi:MAG: energy-coupling factor transporter transmembrane component T family protein [Candidatus Ranarchaeia archaeon]